MKIRKLMKSKEKGEKEKFWLFNGAWICILFVVTVPLGFVAANDWACKWILCTMHDCSWRSYLFYRCYILSVRVRLSFMQISLQYFYLIQIIIYHTMASQKWIQTMLMLQWWVKQSICDIVLSAPAFAATRLNLLTTATLCGSCLFVMAHQFLDFLKISNHPHYPSSNLLAEHCSFAQHLNP